MGRMQACKGKGISSSALPYKRTPPSWLLKSQTAEDIEKTICTLAKKGMRSSEIGVFLRDQQGTSAYAKTAQCMCHLGGLGLT